MTGGPLDGLKWYVKYPLIAVVAIASIPGGIKRLIKR